MATDAPYGERRHQAQPQPPRPRRDQLHSTGPRAGSSGTCRRAANNRHPWRTARPASTGHAGCVQPASKHLISEVKLVAEIAKASLDPNPHVPWDDWVDDYSRIRAAIGETYPDIFYDYDRRMWEPGGFHRKSPAREQDLEDKNRQKANFITPQRPGRR